MMLRFPSTGPSCFVPVHDLDFTLPLRKWVMAIIQDDQHRSSKDLIYYRAKVEGKGEDKVSSKFEER